MSNFEKLVSLCLDQKRSIHTSISERNISIIISKSRNANIDHEIGGSGTLENYCGALIRKLEKTNVVRLVK